MNRKSLAAVSLFAVAVLATAGGARAINVSIGLHDHLALRHDQVVITAGDGSQAKISPAGELTIDGRRIAVPERDRLALMRYNLALHTIEHEGIQIGMQGVGLAVDALSHALVAILTGDKDDVERHIHAKAAHLKERGRELCREAQGLRAIQDSVADDVPAFRPYAILDEHDLHHGCHVED